MSVLFTGVGCVTAGSRWCVLQAVPAKTGEERRYLSNVSRMKVVEGVCLYGLYPGLVATRSG